MDLTAWRLRSVGLSGSDAGEPPLGDHVDVLRRFGAMQSQDHVPALWGLAQRTGQTQAQLSEAFDRGDFLRTHVLRPTWHFVLPEDLPTLLELTAERVHVKNGTYYRQLGLDADVRARYARALDAAAADGPLTRAEAVAVLEGVGMENTSIRLAHVLMHAELEGVLVSGPMRGKQQTLARFADRVPASVVRPRDEALADLARRFAVAHAPVTVKDLAWWAGLTVKDATAALESAGLERFDLDGGVAYAPGPEPAPSSSGLRVQLIQAFDEYVVGYARRLHLPDHTGTAGAVSAERPYKNLVLLDGHVAGCWKRTDGKDDVALDVVLDAPLPEGSLEEAAADVARFAGRKLSGVRGTLGA